MEKVVGGQEEALSGMFSVKLCVWPCGAAQGR